MVHHKNNFSSTGNDPLSERLTITAGGFEDSFSSGIYEATWRESYNEAATTNATLIEEKEPNFLGFYFEGKNGQEIDQDDIKANQEVTLIVQTEYANGDTMELNLNDNKLDFKYDGKIAKNDIIKGIYITGKETRIQLITIKQ